MLEVVIFDLDGLLVDSEPLQYEAYRAAFAGHGVTLERDEWPEWHRLQASAAGWIDAHGLDLDPERIRADKKVIYDDLIASQLTLKPGAGELVEGLAGRYRLCVASGSRLESIEACVGEFSLRPHFECLFSATDLPRKKPYPDVYLEAMSRMGVSSTHAIAIEDSVTGLRAATAAGLACVACPDSFAPWSPPDYRSAALIVKSLEELTVLDLERACREAHARPGH